jgi:hypothetical protein
LNQPRYLELFPELFERWNDQREGVVPTATCACILAVDTGVPTVVARSMLEFARADGWLLRVDLRDVALHQAPADLLHPNELRSIRDFPAPLYAYLSLNAAKASSASFRALMVRLGVTLNLWDRVLFQDGPRLHHAFQVACRELRALYAARPGRHPIGAMLRQEAWGRPGRAWAEELASGSAPYEMFEAKVSTQLVTLVRLALTVGGGTTESPIPLEDGDLDRLGPGDRMELAGRFASLLVDGLEQPPAARSGFMRDLLPGTESAAMSARPIDGMDAWLPWLRKHRPEAWRRNPEATRAMLTALGAAWTDAQLAEWLRELGGDDDDLPSLRRDRNHRRYMAIHAMA